MRIELTDFEEKLISDSIDDFYEVGFSDRMMSYIQSAMTIATIESVILIAKRRAKEKLAEASNSKTTK